MLSAPLSDVKVSVVKSTRHRRAGGGGATYPSGANLVVAIVCLTPLVLLFFLAGVFVGSQFEGSAQSSPPSSGVSRLLGLPGTSNKFARWGKDPVRHLRAFSLSTVMPEARSLPETAIIPLSTSAASATKPSESHMESNKADVDISSLLSASLHATKQSYMTGPSTLDSRRILIGAYVYIEDVPGLEDMRTVFTNKKSGCDKSVGQYGFALFFNAWQTNDKKLYVEYGGESSGCNKLDSGPITLSYRRWYHVAVYLGDRTAKLFIDGSLVSSSTDTESHNVQTENPLVVGVYGNEYSLNGNVSYVAIAHFNDDDKSSDASASDILSAVKGMMDPQALEARKVSNIVAVYPLYDAVSEVPDSPAQEIFSRDTQELHGRYTFPVLKIHGKRVEGVKILLVDGTRGHRKVSPDSKAESDRLARVRRESIKAGMQRAWTAYRTQAWGRDELLPSSHSGRDNWGRMGMTIVDSLDTLWLMGMKTEFQEARDWVANELSFGYATTLSAFEITIRMLGGLLAAFDLSGDEVFLTRAKELGELLLPAFDTRLGIPRSMIDFVTHRSSNGWSGDQAILSELGTMQVEFRYLARHSKRKQFETISMRPLTVLRDKKPPYGLFPIKVSLEDGSFTDSQVTFGALGDSFYEYLLKLWLQGGKKESWLREMYDSAMNGMMEVMLSTSTDSGLAFVADWNGERLTRKMDHLVCFLPGALALGAYHDPSGQGFESPRGKRDLAVAKALAYTCYQMYARTTSKIAPEYVEFPSQPNQGDMVVAHSAPFYILRPETAESLFILNKLTGDPIYREWAWEIWEAIDKQCRTGDAYGSLHDVRNPALGVDNRMESFFLAETMKYLYLAQDPDTSIDLTKVVFNTEAHPLKIFDD